MKLWLGIMIVTDLSLTGRLLSQFKAAESALMNGDLLALIGISWGIYGGVVVMALYSLRSCLWPVRPPFPWARRWQ
jgi:hypothetical protein